MPSWKGISPLVLREAGVTVERDGTVLIPYRHSDGGLHRTRVYAPSGRTWWRDLPDRDAMPLIPFGLETLPSPEESGEHVLVICEGESDTLALRDRSLGTLAVIGCPGASTWRPEWRFHTLCFGLVVVLGDGDAAGRSFNRSVARDVDGAMIVELPEGADVRGIVQRQGFWALWSLVEREAERFDLFELFMSSADLTAYHTRIGVELEV